MNLDSFISEIKGTFLEEILKIEPEKITDKIRPKDLEIGNASLFEKQCFHFYKKSYLERDLTHDQLVGRQAEALVALSIMRLIITKRFNLPYKNVSDIWIREDDVIVVDNEKKMG